MDKIAEIQNCLPDDWKILERVYNILEEGRVFSANTDDKVVNYVEPEQLKRIIDFTIHEDKALPEDEVLEICRKVIKYSVKTNHALFRNQLFGQMDPFGLAGTWISEALNTSAYTFEVAPVFTLMEMEIVQKICALCGYDDGDGIFAPGGSISNMYAIVLARYKKFPEIKTEGLSGRSPLIIFSSEESHYSIKKAAHWLGFGTNNYVVVKTNKRGQMLVDDLEKKIQAEEAKGHIPFFVNATAGTTVLGAFDNLEELADVCERHKLWLHVDACHGGGVLLSKNNKHLLRGIQRTDSFAWDPHKAIGAPLQCALFVTKEKQLLSECNSTDAKYLFQQDKFYDVRYDTGNKSIQCGRKIDSFKIWLMFKARSLSQYGALVDHTIETAKCFAKKIEERPEFLLVMSDFQFANVCFWYIPSSMRNSVRDGRWYEALYQVVPKIKEKMVRKGSLMVGYSPLAYRNIGNFFRMVFTSFPVLSENDLDAILDEIEELGENIRETICNGNSVH